MPTLRVVAPLFALLAALGAPALAQNATAPPLPEPTALPYPAYGTPAPGVQNRTTVPGVPHFVTLPQAVAIAFARSPLLAAARADQGLARAASRLAGTGALPSLAGTASISRTLSGSGGSGAGVSGGTGGTGGGGTSRGGFTNDSLGLNLRQLLFDGGKIAATVRAATINETVAAETYRRELQTVAQNVATAYYAALQAQRATAVAVEIVHQNEVQENLVVAQYRAGTAARTDIATAQFPTAQARVAVVRAQGVELSAQAALANAMGLDADSDVRPVDDSMTAQAAIASLAVLPSYDQAIARALALRPDYSAALNAVRSAEQSLVAARLGRMPTISGTAGVGLNSTTPAGGNLKSSAQVGAALNLPLFDQGITAAQVAQAQAQIDRDVANLETARQGIQLNVKQSLVALITARAALDQTSAEFAKALEVWHATQAQYRAGVTTLPLLLNAQVALTQAQTDQVNAIYAVRQAEQALLYALGENDLSAATL